MKYILILASIEKEIKNIQLFDTEEAALKAGHLALAEDVKKEFYVASLNHVCQAYIESIPTVDTI